MNADDICDDEYAQAKSMRACSGSCNQGRHPCKTPQACELPESDCVERDVTEAIVIAAIVFVVCAAIASVVF
jgi:hypothetical protein